MSVLSTSPAATSPATTRSPTSVDFPAAGGPTSSTRLPGSRITPARPPSADRDLAPCQLPLAVHAHELVVVRAHQLETGRRRGVDVELPVRVGEGSVAVDGNCNRADGVAGGPSGAALSPAPAAPPPP